MQWTLVVTSQELGQPRATAEQLDNLVRRMPSEVLTAQAVQLAAALSLDKSAGYQNVNRQLMRTAPPAMLERFAALEREHPKESLIFFEPWQQLLLARHAARHGAPVEQAVPWDSDECLELFFDACRCINDFGVPPTLPLVRDAVADALTIAASIMPRVWLLNPPDLHDSVARLLIFLDELPRGDQNLQPRADLLRRRLADALGVSLEEALALTAFLGYWSAVPSLEHVLEDSERVRLDPATWLEGTLIPPDTLERLLDRIAQPVEALGRALPPGAGDPWFDPIGFRERPLLRFPDGGVVVPMPEFLIEKASFETLPSLAHDREGRLAVSELCAAYVAGVLDEMASADRVGFVAGVRSDESSIDAMMWHADHLAVIDVSSGFLPNDAKMSGDRDRLRDALRQRWVEGTRADGEGQDGAVARLARAIQALGEKRRHDAPSDVPLRSIQAVYPVMIAADASARTHRVWRYLDSEVRRRLPDAMSWSVAPLAVLGLEDLEWVQGAVLHRHPRLTQALPGLLQVLRWWRDDAERYPTFSHLLQSAIGQAPPVARLTSTFDAWRHRIRARFTPAEAP